MFRWATTIIFLVPITHPEDGASSFRAADHLHGVVHNPFCEDDVVHVLSLVDPRQVHLPVQNSIQSIITLLQQSKVDSGQQVCCVDRVG